MLFNNENDSQSQQTTISSGILAQWKSRHTGGKWVVFLILIQSYLQSLFLRIFLGFYFAYTKSFTMHGESF